jgi:hypothetical protein
MAGNDECHAHVQPKPWDKLKAY